MGYRKSEKCLEDYISAIIFFANRGQDLSESKLRTLAIDDIRKGNLTEEELEQIIEYSEMYKHFKNVVETYIDEGNLTMEELKRILQLTGKRVKEELDAPSIRNGEIVSNPKENDDFNKNKAKERKVLKSLDIDFNPTLEELKKIIKYVEEYRNMFIKDEPEVTPIYNGELGKYPPKSLKRDYDER